jgi:hypothetical protein
MRGCGPLPTISNDQARISHPSAWHRRSPEMFPHYMEPYTKGPDCHQPHGFERTFDTPLKTDKRKTPHTCLYQPHGGYRSPLGYVVAPHNKNGVLIRFANLCTTHELHLCRQAAQASPGIHSNAGTLREAMQATSGIHEGTSQNDRMSLIRLKRAPGPGPSPSRTSQSTGR